LAPKKAQTWLDKHTTSSSSDKPFIAYQPITNDTIPHESNHLNCWTEPDTSTLSTSHGSSAAGIPKHLDGTLSPPYTPDDIESTNDLSLEGSLPQLDPSLAPLTTRETFFLSLKFAALWFTANYFNSACLHFTTVASVTILSSTSSVFTLIFGAFVGVEKFTVKKLLGVLACLAGVVLTSGVDIAGNGNEENRGNFPLKTSKELAIGDALALTAAVLYGLYSVALVKTVGSESRVKMPVFFGFLGIINVCCLWPGFFILDALGVETIGLPPTKEIWGIIVINALSSLISDVCWAYAMLFTSPLVVTVGLSLTIPLSLVGQMVLDDEYASWVYWLGAFIVVMSFVFVNYETVETTGEDIREEEDIEREVR
jgi:solute carrier family 35 protein F5